MSDIAIDQSTAGKVAAARRALELVQPGMILGLGTGSTSRYFIQALAERVEGGLQVTGVPTSRFTAQMAKRLGIPLFDSFDGPLDLAVDGADEIGDRLELIKGRGGALLREKVVAASANRFIVIADESKVVPRLGRGTLPVEVVPFGWKTTAARLEALVSSWTLRGGGEEHPYETDNGNLILDLIIDGGIPDAEDLACRLSQVPGVLAHGLFIKMATGVIVGTPSGEIRILGDAG